MKIFDPSPAITLERPRRLRAIIAGATGVALCLALGAALFEQHETLSTRLAKVSRDLASSQARASQLQADLVSTQAKLDAATVTINRCATRANADTSKLAAFAKQAAACELIREKLHLKG